MEDKNKKETEFLDLQDIENKLYFGLYKGTYLVFRGIKIFFTYAFTGKKLPLYSKGYYIEKDNTLNKEENKEDNK